MGVRKIGKGLWAQKVSGKSAVHIEGKKDNPGKQVLDP